MKLVNKTGLLMLWTIGQSSFIDNDKLIIQSENYDKA